MALEPSPPLFHRGLAHSLSVRSTGSEDSVCAHHHGGNGELRHVVGPGVRFQLLLDELSDCHTALLAENAVLRGSASPHIGGGVGDAANIHDQAPSSLPAAAPKPHPTLRKPAKLSSSTTAQPKDCIDSWRMMENGEQPKVIRKELQVKKKYRAVFKASADNNCSVAWQFEKMLAKDRGRTTRVYAKDEVTCEKAVQALNIALGMPDRNHDDDISFETFYDLLTHDLTLLDVDEEAESRINEIRAMFAQRDMAKIVADHTHTNAETLAQRHDAGECMLARSLDYIGLFMILSNAVVLAANADVEPHWEGWMYIELGFTSFFFLELCVKFWLAGIRRNKSSYTYSFHESIDVFFRGPDKAWNIADVAIVGIAVLDGATTLGTEGRGSAWTLLRLVRLARITKLMRVLRYKIFKELLLMIKGVISGLRTLTWAVVLLAFVICICGLVVRETLGTWCGRPEGYNASRDGDRLVQSDTLCTEKHLQEYGHELFGSFPRSSLTLYRCFTEGCATPGGTPLLIDLWNNRAGPVYVLSYIWAYLAVTFGLFNLIMAVFVENTMEAAKHDEKRRKQLRQMQQLVMARKLQKLVVHFCQDGRPEGSPRLAKAKTSSVVDTTFAATKPFGARWSLGGFAAKRDSEIPKVANLDQEITRDMFENAFADPETEVLLEDLDITLDDPMNLFEALDADGSGTIDVSELIKGLMKLLGSSDNANNNMVASLLSVRAMQKTLREFDARAHCEHQSLVSAYGRIEARLHDCTAASQNALALAELAAGQMASGAFPQRLRSNSREKEVCLAGVSDVDADLVSDVEKVSRDSRGSPRLAALRGALSINPSDVDLAVALDDVSREADESRQFAVSQSVLSFDACSHAHFFSNVKRDC